MVVAPECAFAHIRGLYKRSVFYDPGLRLRAFRDAESGDLLHSSCEERRVTRRPGLHFRLDAGGLNVVIPAKPPPGRALAT